MNHVHITRPALPAIPARYRSVAMTGGERAAGLSVREDDTDGLRTVKYEPYVRPDNTPEADYSPDGITLADASDSDADAPLDVTAAEALS